MNHTLILQNDCRRIRAQRSLSLSVAKRIRQFPEKKPKVVCWPISVFLKLRRSKISEKLDIALVLEKPMFIDSYAGHVRLVF
jgi:hypothetical protein